MAHHMRAACCVLRAVPRSWLRTMRGGSLGAVRRQQRFAAGAELYLNLT
jgi:hypothetical protein